MDMVAHACDPSTHSAEAGEPLWVPDQPRYQGKGLSQKQTQCLGGGAEVQIPPQLQSKFKANLRYRRPNILLQTTHYWERKFSSQGIYGITDFGLEL